jgi:hypothetical protein
MEQEDSFKIKFLEMKRAKRKIKLYVKLHITFPTCKGLSVAPWMWVLLIFKNGVYSKSSSYLTPSIYMTQHSDNRKHMAATCSLQS